MKESHPCQNGSSKCRWRAGDARDCDQGVQRSSQVLRSIISLVQRCFGVPTTSSRVRLSLPNHIQFNRRRTERAFELDDGLLSCFAFIDRNVNLLAILKPR